MMKMVFLFEKELSRKFNLDKAIAKDALPDFSAFDFGPFSSQVFTDLEFLVDLRFVSPKPIRGSQVVMEESMEYSYWQAGVNDDTDHGGPEHEEDFSLTALGQQFVQEGHAGTLTKRQQEVLDEFKARCTAASLRALLRYVYTKYPDTTTESKIRDEILAENPY